ncbi:MAG: hypothetical protein KC561_18770, partial [Myxococcales bacterium]|nr:hypothetical protein [Myxococcales bacterium]
LQYAQQENYAAASLLFWRVWSESDGSDALLYRAQFELGKALYAMRLYYPALFYFDDIVATGPDHPMFIPTYPWLLRLNRRLPGEPAALERLSEYADFFPDQIEDKYQDEMAYLIGRYYYSRGLLEEAQDFLATVSVGNRRFLYARYLEGVTYIQQYDGQAAVDAFRDVLEQAVEDPDRDAEVRNLAELSVLAVARTFYSTGEFEKAVRWYDQVPASSQLWLEALFEKAWALFQVEDYNRSLGNLHSLNSPFFNDQFYPEGNILTAVIFFRNCNYEALRETIDEFEEEYQPILDEFTNRLNLSTDDEYYDMILSIRGEMEEEFSPQLQQVMNAALDSQAVRDAIAFVEELDRELAFIQGADPQWLETGLGDEIITETGLARSVGASYAGSEIRLRVERAERHLQSLMNQAAAILVETDLLQDRVVSSELRNELNLSSTGSLLPPVDDEHLLWHFAGDYWRDELGYYWYALESQCAE